MKYDRTSVNVIVVAKVSPPVVPSTFLTCIRYMTRYRSRVEKRFHVFI